MMVEKGRWQPEHTYVEGDRIIYKGIEYEFRDGRFVPIHKTERQKMSWLERWHNMLPFVIIITDIAFLSWIGIRYWETVRPYFDIIVALNVVGVILFTLLVMIGVETYIEDSKK